jgi:hypothetical protein
MNFELISLDCKLPIEVSKIIWAYKPYHALYKSIQNEITFTYIINILKKIFKSIRYNTGISSILFSISQDIVYEYYISDKLMYNYKNGNYQSYQKDYINIISKKINIDFTYIHEFLEDLYEYYIILNTKEQMEFLNTLNLNIFIEYDKGTFNPDNEFNNPKWIGPEYLCRCGNLKSYKWYDDNFDISLTIKWTNIHARSYYWCNC